MLLNGLSAGLQTKGSLVQFPIRAHAWVAGWVPGGRHVRDNHTLTFPSLSFSLPSPLSKNKSNKTFKKNKEKGKWPLPTFLSGRKLSPSSRLDVRHFSFSLYATGSFQATIPVLELGGSESE